MTAGTWLAAAALAVAAVLAVAALRTRMRLARLELAIGRLDARVRDDLEPRVFQARADARAAGATARDAAIAAGVAVPPPRLPLEPVTGRVVRAVALGATARRALARVATAPWTIRREERRSA